MFSIQEAMKCALEAAQHCIVQRKAIHTTHSTNRQLYKSRQVLQEGFGLSSPVLHRIGLGKMWSHLKQVVVDEVYA